VSTKRWKTTKNKRPARKKRRSAKERSEEEEESSEQRLGVGFLKLSGEVKFPPPF
jgi:hypothetical protein